MPLAQSMVALPAIPPTVAGSPAPAPATVGIVRINEVLSNPGSAWNCSNTLGYSSATDGWVELYNPQSQAFNLYAGHALLDGGYGTNAYYFPLGASIAAHGFLVLFPFTTVKQSYDTTASLRLVIGGAIVDQIIVPALNPDQSYARLPDGGTSWQTTYTPTIDASNTTGMTTPTATPTHKGNTGNLAAIQAARAAVVVRLRVAIQSWLVATQPNWGAINLPVTATAAVATPSTVDNSATNNQTSLSSPAPVASSV